MYSWQQPSLGGELPALYHQCVQLPWAAIHSYFATGIYFPQHLLCCRDHCSTAMSWGKGEAWRDVLINVTHTHRSDKSSAGVLHPHLHYTFHIGTHILVLPLLAQSSLSVRNTLSSILQNQSLNFYLNLDSAVCDTSDENSKLCWIRKLLNFSSSHPTLLTDYLKA